MNLKSKNPFLRNKSFAEESTVYDAEGNPVNVIDYNNTMTVKDTINKSMFLLALLVTSAIFSGYLMLFLRCHLSPIYLLLRGKYHFFFDL